MTLLLVLRPEPGATSTATRARAAGFAVAVAPLFDVVPQAWEPPGEPIDAVMMTSANAARHGGPHLARYFHLPLHAVGAETGRAAAAAGFRDVRAGQADAAALAGSLGQAGRVLHLTGREHRAALPPGGVRRIVYAADAVTALPDAAAAALATGAVVLLHSPRAAARFEALVDGAGIARGGVALAALSPAVADAAGAGWRRVVAAPRPTDAALLHAIGEAGDWG